jgi:hypothetical protein
MHIVLGSLFRIFARHADTRNHTCAAQEVIRDKETESFAKRRTRSERRSDLTTTIYPIDS